MPSAFAASAAERKAYTQKFLDDLEKRSDAVHGQLVDAVATLQAARAVVDALQRERDDNAAQIARLRAILDEIPQSFDPTILERMPVELLADIMRLVVQPRSSFQEYGTATYDAVRASAPIVLSWVCHRWRDIAVNTPDLWCYVAAPLLKPVERRRPVMARSYIARVQAFLKRSGTRPLHVILDWCFCTHLWDDMPEYQTVLTAVSLHISRWEQAYIYLPNGITSSTLEFLRHPTPTLVAIEVYNGDDLTVTKWADVVPYPTYLPHCPRLRHMEAGSMFLKPRQPLLLLVRAAIYIEDPPPHAVWDSLCMMPNLEDLSIHFITLRESPPEPPASELRLPSLRKLTIGGDGAILRSWATMLCMPKLVHLSLTESSRSIDWEVIAPFLDSVVHTVNELTFEVAGENLAGVVPDYFGAFNLVQCVNFRNVHDTPATLWATLLRRTDGSTPYLWPALNSIVFERGAISSQAAEALVDMVISRMPAENSPLDEGTAAPEFKVAFRSVACPTWLSAQLALILHDNLTAKTPSALPVISDDDDDDDEWTAESEESSERRSNVSLEA
ncbi:hypothetical protein EXIGLDRAFT_731579 [Exidia glandulosa HHB12029]|uniref:F-box domain-containing protein n=1 Tax=Exidia glandulosa HHB12029 TaxID=1314781 RepID=A0A165BTF7_EXIGL|nr:hypothetical protein EXIGLDRAFT_731579 [Exidia glandulosa HHB12029]